MKPSGSAVSPRLVVLSEKIYGKNIAPLHFCWRSASPSTAILGSLVGNGAIVLSSREGAERACNSVWALVTVAAGILL